jgi:hypothetical protein
MATIFNKRTSKESPKDMEEEVKELKQWILDNRTVFQDKWVVDADDVVALIELILMEEEIPTVNALLNDPLYRETIEEEAE